MDGIMNVCQALASLALPFLNGVEQHRLTADLVLNINCLNIAGKLNVG